MSSKYYLMNYNSESVAKILATPSAFPSTGAATNSQTVNASSTITLSYITAENIPSSTSWGTQAIAATFKITTTNVSIQFAITPYRVNSSGTVQQTGTQSPFVTASSASITCTCSAFAFTAGSATDRMAIDLAIKNTSGSSKTVAFEVNTINTYINSPITEWSGSNPGSVSPNGQYGGVLSGTLNDYALVAIGENSVVSTDAITTPLYLETDVYSKAPAYNTAVSEEAKPVGTSLANSADVTTQSRALREQALPTSRRGAVMGYDSVNNRYITIGGYDGATRYNDLWELSADGAYSRWHLLSPTGTAPQVKNLGASVMICNSTNTKAWFLYFGGANSSGNGVNDLNILDCSTRGSEVWTSVTQTNAPSARDYTTFHMFARPTGSPHTTTFDVYMWGGWTQAGPRANDMYKISLDLSGAVPSSLTWATITQTSAPTARSGTCIIYDSLNDRAVMFGGYDGTTYLNDLRACAFTGGSTVTWTTITPASPPSGRELACCGYDVVGQRMFVFGGWQGTVATNFNDIIRINLTSGSESYTTIRATSSTNYGFFPMSSGCAAVDTNRRIIVSWAINGYDSTDKYIYAFDMGYSSGTAPMYGLNVIDDYRGRDGIAFCVDTTRSTAIVGAGYSTIDDDTTITRGDHCNQLWSYDWTANALRYAAAGWLGIPPHEGALFVYDSVNDRIIMYGGLVGTAQVCNEVWEIRPDTYGNYKARRLGPSGTAAPARFMCHGAFDSARTRMVVWGGKNATALLSNATVYILDLSTTNGSWSSQTPASPPTAVWQGGFAMDDTNHKLYIAGGCTNQGDTTYNGTLSILDVSGASVSWSAPSVTGSITASRGLALAIDTSQGYLWGFGGYNGSVVNSNLYNFKISTTTWTTVTATGGPPEARRSAGGYFGGGKYYVTGGRPVAGRWYSNWWELTPNYSTLNSSSWANKIPTTYQKDGLSVTGKTNTLPYHWQAKATINGTDTSWASFGSNSESVTDFIAGYDVRSTTHPFFYP